MLPFIAASFAVGLSAWAWIAYGVLAVICALLTAETYRDEYARDGTASSRSESWLLGIGVGGLAPLLAATLLVGLIEGAIWLVMTGAPQAGAWIADLSFTHVMTEPITHWFTVHATGLPVSAGWCGLVWGVFLALLWLTAWGSNPVGRVMFPLAIAATAAMTWFGTTVPAHRPVTVGAVALVGTVAAWVAYRRRLRLV